MKNRGGGGDPDPKKANYNHDEHVFKGFFEAMSEPKQPEGDDELCQPELNL